MIAHDLRCSNGHRYEAWFRNFEAFADQRRRGLLSCPSCGTAEVEILNSPGVVRKPSLGSGAREGAEALRRFESFLAEHFEDVGRRFAEEARRQHYGESGPRAIRGEATAQEERELLEEGVPFIRVGLPKPSS